MRVHAAAAARLGRSRCPARPVARVAGGGGIGTRGPGETKIETDRRRIRTRMAKLRREIAAMSTARDTKRSQRAPQRGARRWRSPATPTPASPRCSTGSPTPACWSRTRCSPPWIRRCAGPRRPTGATTPSTDTVGFVRHLPHQLVEAFRSTLEEVADADLILHVVDGSRRRPRGSARRGPRGARPRSTRSTCPELVVINKADVADPDGRWTGCAGASGTASSCRPGPARASTSCGC